MRRWNRPIHDFLAPYVRGGLARLTGSDAISDDVRHRRDLDTLTDMPTRLRPSPPVFSKCPLRNPLPLVWPAGPATPCLFRTISSCRPGYATLRFSRHAGFFSFSLPGYP
jgi:hypothetical protein